MLVVVTLISFLVNVYSIGYMAGDPDIRRYFAMLGFFTFSMLGIVARQSAFDIYFLGAGRIFIVHAHWTLE